MTIVLDNGGQFLKIGFAKTPDSIHVSRNVIGYPMYSPILTEAEREVRYFYAGVEAINLQGVLTLVYPVNRGRIDEWDPQYRTPSTRPKNYEGNWDALTKIWSHVLEKEMKVDNLKVPFLVIVPTSTSNEARERIASIFLNEFKAQSVAITGDAELSLYAAQKETGVIVQCGATITSIVPIHNGEPILEAIRTMDVAGRDIDRHLVRLLRMSGWLFHGDSENDIFRDMKENLCFIAGNTEEELIKADKGEHDKQYYLPDGQSVTIGSARFQAPELFFNPRMMHIESEPLEKLIIDSIESCPAEIKQDLYINIILAGGSSLFPGFKERLQIEISKLTPEGTIARTIAPGRRGFFAWYGGTLVAKDESLMEKWRIG